MSTIRTAFFCVILAFLVAGCGQVVTERLTTPQSQTGGTRCAVTKSMVVLPFADYSYADDLSESSFKRNIAVMEALTDQLSGKGYRLPAYEDTVKYLIDNDIVKVVSFEGQGSGNYASSLQNELDTGEWSDQMKNELRKQIQIQDKSSSQPSQGMDKLTIARIGSDFKADYILRGRILKYDFRDTDDSWNPLKRGLIPIIFPDATNRFLFGIANPEFYDMVDDFATRGVVGNALVHLRVWVQDASTGEVIWTNRAEVKVTPRTSFAGRNVDDLFHTAVNQAVFSLIEDFWMKTEAYL